ncbi:hypothetical protein Q1695_014122 [Nippostrongylus brasiliensis]|nr:hypothetical protein Q1695_014122 [Nippostrongylus brasiliensis]
MEVLQWSFSQLLQEGKCAYCILLMSCYWVGEVVPLAVTSFLPLVILPFLGVLSVKRIAEAYLADTNMMFVTSLMLSLAVEECQLHKRIALKMLTFVGAKPQWLLAGFMIITSFISLWISDTACAALMAPIAYALLEAIMVHKMGPPKSSTSDIALEEYKELDKRFYPGEDTGISYLSWMAFAIPPMVGYMISSWLIVQIQFLGFRYIFGILKQPTEEEKADERNIRKAVKNAYDELGPITFAEKSTFVIFVLTVASWITSDPKVINGWATFFKKGYVTDTCSGMLAVFILFVWPREMPDFVCLRPESDRSRPSEKREALLTWDAVKRRFPWSVILLLGAGFAISKSVKESGLSSLIACNLDRVLAGYPFVVMQMIISVITVTLTEFSTNSATASIMIPIAFNIAESVRAHPLYFSIPAAIGPSFSFMLPMATPPNAIVYESGTMRMIDMEGRCAYCILLMASYWIAEVVPLAVTSFLPMVLLPFLGVMSIKKTARSYFSETNAMFMANLMLSLAVEECNLHRRIALKMLTFVGSKPPWILAGFMGITCFISLWISDTACAAMMAPIAMAVAQLTTVNETETVQNGNKVAPRENNNPRNSIAPSKSGMSPSSDCDRGFCKCLMLATAHASLIGGTGTLNGSTPNLVLVSALERSYGYQDTRINYLSWMTFSIPPMLFYLLSTWLVVQIRFRGLRSLTEMFDGVRAQNHFDDNGVQQAIQSEYRSLGPMTFAEKSTLIIFVLTIVSWLTRDPTIFSGWSTFYESHYVNDACSGMLAVFVLFVWPKQMPDFAFLRSRADHLRPSERRESLLTWEIVRRRYPWSIILVLGAGFTISESVQESGLSSLIACNIRRLVEPFPLLIMQAIISSITVVLTEFMSNTATASIIIPIAITIADSIRVHPLYFALPVAVSSSFSFMLPMASPPNTIVYETGTIRMIDMISCGVFMNVLCVLVTTLNMNTWAYWLLDLGNYPNYAINHNGTMNCRM